MDPMSIPLYAQSFLSQERQVAGTISGADIGFLLLFLVIAYLCGKIVVYSVRRRYTHRLTVRELKLISRFTYIVLFLLAFAISVPALFDLSLNLVVYLAIAGILVIWLSSQKVITNIIAGIGLIFERPATAGDYITNGDTSGIVIATGTFSTIVRTTSGVYVRIPNDDLFTTRMKNYRAHSARRFEYTLGIRFRDDIMLATRLIRETLEKNPYVLSFPPPDIFVSDIGESAVQVRIRVWFPSVYANERDDISLQGSTLASLKGVLEANGVAFPYPQRVLHFNGEEVEYPAGFPAHRGQPVSAQPGLPVNPGEAPHEE